MCGLQHHHPSCLKRTIERRMLHEDVMLRVWFMWIDCIALDGTARKSVNNNRHDIMMEYILVGG